MTDEEKELEKLDQGDEEPDALEVLETKLADKCVENERLGSQVTNLELDVRRRDERIAAMEDDQRRVVQERDAALEENVEFRESLIETAEEIVRLKGLLVAAVGGPGPAPVAVAESTPRVCRERLPDDRFGKTFKLRIGVDEKLCPECKVPLPGSRVSGHLTLNRYPDGRLGEMFLALDRHRRGDLAATFAHQFAIMVSIALQYGVPPKVIYDRLRHVRDESGGYIIHEVDGKLAPEEHGVGSIIDLIAIRMEQFCQEVKHG